MSLQGQWLCYRPRAFARGRDYQVLCGTQAVSAHLTDAFTVVAEGMLRAQGDLAEPTWQYVPLGDERLVALCRCAAAELSGARSLVVWALLLPHAYVRSTRFGLAGLPEQFPGATLGTELPAALDLVRVAPSTPADRELDPLISCYLDTGSLQVNLEPLPALRLFAGVVETLAPRDRVEVSFATAPGSARALAVDAAAPPPQEIPVSVEGLVRLELWRFMRFRLAGEALQNASLRDRTAPWLCSLMRSREVRASYAGLINEARAHLTSSLHDVAFGYLRRALEMRLSELPSEEAARALTALAEDRLLTSEAGVPPLWLPRMALKKGCVADLSPALRERVLQAEVLPMILESVQQAPAAARLANLARAAETTRLVQARRREMRQACAPVIREILGQVQASRGQALREDRTLVRAFCALLLHELASRPAA